MPDNRPLKIEKERLLLVEGNDEIVFFLEFFRHLSVDSVQIIEVKGKEQFKNEIPLLKNIPDFSKVQKIGIIRDADNDFNATLNSVFDRLEGNGFSPVKQHGVFSAGVPLTGIFIMPGNEKTGALEDLCLSALEPDSILQCAHQFFNCIKTDSQVLNKASKRIMQVYLSAKHELCDKIGLAAQKNYLNFSSAVYDELKDFILKLSE